MQLTIEQPVADELEVLVALTVQCQRTPKRRIPFLGDDAASITADIVELGGETTWHQHALAARNGASTVGWLFAESDPEMGRIWWFGPFVDVEVDDEQAGSVADALYAQAASLREGFDEEEICYDERSTLLVEFGRRNGFTEQAASLALRAELDSGPRAAEVAEAPEAIHAPRNDAERTATAHLHDELFPGTHTRGTTIAQPPTSDRSTWCIAEGDDVVAYIAVEHQSDSSLYIDYLGVRPGHRGRGHARTLVRHALAHGAMVSATHAHLTVRLANASARGLYRSLGFADVMTIVPARKGFLLGTD
jgi:ribosomal protein S18 acetylase RimI-like enzyme